MNSLGNDNDVRKMSYCENPTCNNTFFRSNLRAALHVPFTKKERDLRMHTEEFGEYEQSKKKTFIIITFKFSLI